MLRIIFITLVLGLWFESLGQKIPSIRDGIKASPPIDWMEIIFYCVYIMARIVFVGYSIAMLAPSLPGVRENLDANQQNRVAVEERPQEGGTVAIMPEDQEEGK